MSIRDKEIDINTKVGLLSSYKGHVGTRSAQMGKKSLKYEGKTYKRWKAGYSPRDKDYQGEMEDKEAYLCECGAEFGQYHELGCDLERCPVCKGQLLSCGHGSLFETSHAKCR